MIIVKLFILTLLDRNIINNISW